MQKWWRSLTFDGQITAVVVAVFLVMLAIVIATVRPDPPCTDVAFVAPVSSVSFSCPHRDHHGAVVPIEIGEETVGVSLMCMCHDPKETR